MAPLRVDVNVGVIMQFVTGVVTRARDFEHDVLLLTQDDHAGVERVAAGSMVDAVIMMDVEAEDPRLPILRRQRQPAVLIGLPRDAVRAVVRRPRLRGRRPAPPWTTSSASGTARSRSSARRRVVLDRHTTYALRMVSGFRAETERLGVDAVFEPCESSHAGAVDALDRVLDRLPGVTGLVVHNEVALPAVLAGLRERGIEVPRDMSVVAVCPQDVATGQPQQLTSVDIPADPDRRRRGRDGDGAARRRPARRRPGCSRPSSPSARRPAGPIATRRRAARAAAAGRRR